MKNSALIFLAAFLALGGSWCGFVLAPQLQLGGMKQTTILNSSDVYPVGRSGGANLGLQAYRANGCAACHTKQVRQDGVACDVILVDAGKNRTAVQAIAQAVNPALPGLIGSRQTILQQRQQSRRRRGSWQNFRRGREGGNFHHRHWPGHCPGLGFARQCGRGLSLRQSGPARQPARRSGPDRRGFAAARHQLAIASPLCTTKPDRRLDDAAVSLPV